MCEKNTMVPVGIIEGPEGDKPDPIGTVCEEVGEIIDRVNKGEVQILHVSLEGDFDKDSYCKLRGFLEDQAKIMKEETDELEAKVIEVSEE